MGNCLSESEHQNSPKESPRLAAVSVPLNIVPGDLQNIGYLMHEIIVRNNLQQCAYLLQMGFPIDAPLKYSASIPVNAEVNDQNIFYYEFYGTALHVACIYRKPAIVEILMQHNANPNIADRFGRTPVILTVTYWPRVAIMNAENKGFSNTVMSSIPKKSYRCLECLCVNGADVNKSFGPVTETALHLAARYHIPTCAKVLLNFGANVQACDSKGMTPLHYACQRTSRRKEDLELIDLLITHGANVNQQDQDGNAPLHLAAQNGSTYFISHLLYSDANPELANNRGLSPLYLILDGAQSATKIHALNAILNESTYLRIFNLERQLPALLLLPEYGSVCATLVYMASTPPSLKLICRQFIRKKIGIRNVRPDILQQIPLPPALCDLLLTQPNYVIGVNG